MKFIDVHCHLELCEKEGNLGAMIGRAREKGVCAIVAQGVNPQANRKVLELAKTYKEVKAALGLYPIDALALSDIQVDKELGFIRAHREEIVAIGEVGLDFKEDETQHERQKEIFRKIIALAKELDKPLIVHSRKAEEACITILEELSAKKVIMHCFCGKWKHAERTIANGWFLSVPTNVTVSEQFQRIASELPLTRLFCETDAPYLHPERLWPNEPALVVQSYEMIAKLKGIPLEDVCDVLIRNYQNLFGKV